MPLRVRNRHRLKRKEIKSILDELKNSFGSCFFNSNVSVEIGDVENFRVILVDGEIDFLIHENKVVFTLHGLNKYKLSDYFVVVDMGAVGFVTRGADIMTPGIVDADVNIRKDDFVWICDEKHRKPLAVGIALINGEEMKSKKTGKAVKNIHYVGDKLWKTSTLVT
jgi:PUA domain protein